MLVAVLLSALLASAQQSAEELFQKGDDCCDAEKYAEAAGYWLQAAQMGHAQSQCVIGVCYQEGIGVAVDNAQAIYWLTQAANQNDADAQCR